MSDKDFYRVMKEDSRRYFGQPQGPGCGTVLLIVGLIVALLTGCKTVETEYVYKTDTLIVSKTDTVKEVQIKVEKRDSLVHDSVFVQVDAEGKVVYKEVWRDRYVSVFKSDSLDKYRAMCDSLIKKMNNTEKEKVIVTKTDYTGWWAFGGVLLVLGGAVLIVYKLKR